MEFLFELPMWVWLVAIGAVAALFVYYYPEKIYGKEYKEAGKVKEVDHEPDRSYTSTGTTFVNGHVGVSTQYHSIPEEHQGESLAHARQRLVAELVTATGNVPVSRQTHHGGAVAGG